MNELIDVIVCNILRHSLTEDSKIFNYLQHVVLTTDIDMKIAIREVVQFIFRGEKLLLVSYSSTSIIKMPVLVGYFTLTIQLVL